MIAGQLAGVISLRELEVMLDSHPECHYHSRTKNVKRPTLSYANNNRKFMGENYIAILIQILMALISYILL